MQNPSASETAAAVLSAKLPHEQLGLISAAATYEAARAAYKRLALLLHPDKNPSCAACAEAFKVITNAFNQLQSQQEQRGSGAPQQAGTVTSADQGPSRWGVFTSRPAWAPGGPTHAPAHQAAATTAPPPAGHESAAYGGARPAGTRWGRAGTEYGSLHNPPAIAQPAKPAEQVPTLSEAQENIVVDNHAAQGSKEKQGSRLPTQPPTATGVAPSAFYLGRSRRTSQPPQPTSLYSLFGAAQPLQKCSSNDLAASGASDPQKGTAPVSQVGNGVGLDGGSKWGSKPASLMGLLRPPAQQPSQVAVPETDYHTALSKRRELAMKEKASCFSGNSSRRRHTPVLDSPDSDGPAAPSHHDSEKEATSSTASDSDSSVSDPGEAVSPPRDGLGGMEQRPGNDATASQLQAAVQRHEAGALLASREAGKAVVLAGRKRALQRHYSRSGKGRQKKSGSGMQVAKLQLVAVSSKRSRK